MKTAITQSMRIPSIAAHSVDLNSRLATRRVVDVKGSSVPELLKDYPRQGNPKSSVMSLAMAIGASSFASMAFSSPAIVSNSSAAPKPVSSELSSPQVATPAQPFNLASINQLGNISKVNPPVAQPLPFKVEPLPMSAKQAPAIPTVQPISDISVAQPQQPSGLTTGQSMASLPAAATPSDDNFVYPLNTPTPVGSPFGWRVHPISGKKRLHSGMDFEAPEGTPVVAATAGRVVSAGWMGGYGKTIVIERAGRLQTRYAHLSNISVQPGQQLQAGTLIGAVGSTGRSTGPHLHFEILVATPANNWMAIDPAPGVQYALGNLQQILQANQSSVPGG